MRKFLFATLLLVCSSIYAAGNNWMAAQKDISLLSQLSIPGTHDSGARFEPIAGTAKCQNLTIAEQLAIGVRALDIRCRHIDNSFTIHHGYVYQNMNFTDVLNACSSFLAANPSETIIMSVKEEYDPSNNTRTFVETFNSYVNQNPGLWHMGTKIPALGQVRGKIVLFRRFGGVSNLGLEATSWGDDTTFSIGGAAPMRVQDNYSNGSGSEKWTDVNNMLNEASSGSAGTLYVNFTSGYTSFLSIPSITTVSNYVNPRLETYFNSNPSSRFGMLMMDFINATRAQLIYQTNIVTTAASTKAYWRFEAGPSGSYVTHTGTAGAYYADIADTSGNNNGLAVWQTGSTGGYIYSSNVANSIVPRTTKTNNMSVRNSGSTPSMFSGTAAMRSWNPQAFTLEATIKFAGSGNRTYIGRDSQGTNSNAALSALYLQSIPNNGLAFKFCDSAGNWHEAVSATNIISSYDQTSNPNGNNVPWYSLAAISDGKVMSLYLKNHSNTAGYQLIAHANVSGTNTRLSTGAGSGTGWQAGNFSVGRGLYNGVQTDRAPGFIDEVRISEGALDISELLHSYGPHNPSVSQTGTGSNTANVTLSWKAALTPGANTALNLIANQYVFMSQANGSTLYYIGSTNDPGSVAATSMSNITVNRDAQYKWQIANARLGAESSLTVNVSTIANVNANSIFGPVWSFNSLPSAAAISSQPVGGLVSVTENFNMSVSATSSSPLSYNWYFSPDNLIGDDELKASGSATLTLNNIQADDQGYYYCKVSNSSNESVYSQLTLLEVRQLTAWYKFENNLLDSAWGAIGTAPGAALTYTSGIVNNSITLNGIDQYALISRPIQNSFSIELWIKTTDIGGTGGWWNGKGLIDGEMAGSVNDFGTVISGSKFGFGTGNPDNTITSQSDINDGQWHHCLATRDHLTGEMKIYIDGELETTAIGATGIKDSPATLALGRVNTGSNYANCAIDELKLYNYPLSELQAAAAYYDITGIEVCLASQKPSEIFDFNNDCRIDISDLQILIENWLICGKYPDCFN